jgi:hypothetical protein
MHAKLQERAKALGLDEAVYVRMLIYADVNGVSPPRERRALPEVGMSPHPQASGYYALDETEAHPEEPEPLPVEPIDVPIDPEPQEAQPSLLDEMDALLATPAAPPRPPMPRHMPRFDGYDRGYGNAYGIQRRGYGARGYGQPYGQPFYGPGSMTRAVGVGEGTMGNFMGDGHGNVTRDNFGHFGFVGTRSR